MLCLCRIFYLELEHGTLEPKLGQSMMVCRLELVQCRLEHDGNVRLVSSRLNVCALKLVHK